MRLSIMERLVLAGVLPTEESFVTLRVVRDLKERLLFTEDELREYNIHDTEDRRIAWDVSVQPQEKDIEIGERATDVIVESLKKLNDSKKLGEQHFSLYEKFIEGGA